MKKNIIKLALLVLVLMLSACTTPSLNNQKEDYTDYTTSEKTSIVSILGEEVPFFVNNDYTLTFNANGFTMIIKNATKEECENYVVNLKNNGYVDSNEEVMAETDVIFVVEKGKVVVAVAFISMEFESEKIEYAYLKAFLKSETPSVPNPDTPVTPEPQPTGGFTADEAALFNTYFGLVIPFLNASEYYVEDYYDGYGCINYYTLGNTANEYTLYRALLVTSGYAFTEEYIDDYGDTCYVYVKNDVAVDICAYTSDEGEYVIDIYVYFWEDEDNGNAGGSTGGDTGNTGNYTYTEFSSSEKQLFLTYIGVEIPFAPTNEYYVEGYYDETGYEYGMCYYTFGNTQADFDAYKNTLVSWGYVLYETYQDDYGDTWYTYINDDVVIDVSFYYYESDYVIDLYVYSSLSKDYEEGGNTGGSTGGGNDSSDVDLITNDGKGLPTGTNGVHNVDFTNATYVKNVTDQGYYLDGCPTTGDVKVLVIPVEFSDRTASSLGYTLDRLDKAFNGVYGTTKYYSVSEYYFKSSYGKLNLEFDILDSWFRPSNTSSYYKNYTMDYYGSEINAGDQVIMDEALAYLESRMDLSEYDSDNNNIIDAVVMISTVEIGDDDFNWAYRYWNLYTDSDGYYYEYDGVSANDYLWASYEFMFETYDSEGNVSYTDKTNIDTYTYIHEFGHVLGCDDYYDTAYQNEPMQGCDIMDSGLGDHNPFTKFNYGWLTTSRVVTTDNSVTLTLEDFSKNGDSIIIANNWDDTLGAYQEYYVIMYYKMTGLNGGDAGYFATDGIIVYHVNASLYKEVIDGETYYDIYYNNTDASDEYGTEENLIELVETTEGTIVHREGMTSNSNILDDNGNKISYVFTVDSLTDTTATITFTKNN